MTDNHRHLAALAALLVLSSGACAAETPTGPLTAASGANDAGVADTPAAAPGPDANARGTADAAASLDAAPHAADALAGDTAAAAPVPTWHRDVAPIVVTKCAGCHVEGAIGPMPLTSYATAKPFAKLLAKETQNGAMPPWGARDTAECKPRFGWQHDLRLTTAERATIAAWTAAGAPEGNAQDAQPAKPIGLDLTAIDLVTQPKAAFTASGSKDQFICFVLDAQFTETKYLNGIQVVAGNAGVVHHALVFLDPKADSPAKADAQGQYPCFGGIGLSGAQLVGAWAPGSVPLEFPANVGTPIGKGARLVMQVHYHPAGKSHAADLSKVQLRFTKQTPAWQGATVLIGNFPVGKNGEGLLPGPNDPATGPAFVIPAGAKDHTETMAFTMPASNGGKALGDLHVYAVGTHMHYIGTSMRIDVTRPAASVEPKDECLIETPDWDFDWQRIYVYDTQGDLTKLPMLRAGDKVTMTCRYDNTLANPGVQAALQDAGLKEPIDVKLGESTLDEMCLSVIQLIGKTK